jgi:Na+-driven multidrug efflux pump
VLADILRVGAISTAGVIQSNLTVAIVTSAVGHFGARAVAGYGVASRLDYFLFPLLFSLGVTTATMVGTNVAAQQLARAKRIAWSGALIGGMLAEVIGVAGALFSSHFRWTVHY